MSALQALPKDEYTVALICALPSEMAGATEMLDELHRDLQEQDPSDHNTYNLGRMQNHNVVIACLPAGIYGTNSAANVAKDMLRTFKSIRFGLMVGIGGGAPSPANDIRLGDIVVSQPSGTSGGVVQYDRGNTVEEGSFTRTGTLNSPPMVLLTALSRMQAEHEDLTFSASNSRVRELSKDTTKPYPPPPNSWRASAILPLNIDLGKVWHPRRALLDTGSPLKLISLHSIKEPGIQCCWNSFGDHPKGRTGDVLGHQLVSKYNMKASMEPLGSRKSHWMGMPIDWMKRLQHLTKRILRKLVKWLQSLDRAHFHMTTASCTMLCATPARAELVPNGEEALADDAHGEDCIMQKMYLRASTFGQVSFYLFPQYLGETHESDICISV
jgi:hypothetical protein